MPYFKFSTTNRRLLSSATAGAFKINGNWVNVPNLTNYVGGGVAPSAPTAGVVDNTAKTFDWTYTTGFAAYNYYEYSINGSGYTPVRTKPLVVDNVNIAIGSLKVRVKSIGANPASADLTNGSAFTSVTKTTSYNQIQEQFNSSPNWWDHADSLIYVPPTYFTDLSKRYPLVLFLHGSGEAVSPTPDFALLARTAIPQLLADGMQPSAVDPADSTTKEFIVVSPQHSWWSFGINMPDIQYIIADIVKRYRVDESMIYITGLSAGAQGTVSAVTNDATFASKIAAIAPISFSGWNQTQEQTDTYRIGGERGVSMWAAIGANDSFLSRAQDLQTRYNGATSPAPAHTATLDVIAGVAHDAGCWNTFYALAWKTHANNSKGLTFWEWCLTSKRTDPTYVAGQNSSSGGGGGGTDPTPPPSTPTSGSGDVVITVKFVSAPTSASSSVLKTKYGKPFIYDFCIDDNPSHFLDFVNYIQGGFNRIDSVTYPGKTVTDGCGNTVKWAATVACNVKNSYNDNFLMDSVNGYNSISKTDLPGLVAKKCYPAVHGYYHFDDPAATSPDGYKDNGFTRSNNVSECAKYIWQNSGGFLPRIMVIPQDSGGYNIPLKIQGYFAQSSQGVYDNEKRFPDVPEIYNHGNIKISDVITWYNTPGAYSAFGRRYIYDWTDSVNQTGPALADVDYALSIATQAEPQMLRSFTHGVDGANWATAKAFFESLQTKGGDNLWFATLQEVMEYLECYRLVQKTESLVGDTLTIRLNYNNVPVQNLLRDLSLKVTANATIQSITVTNAQSSSYNVSTGLVNVFVQRYAGLTAYPYSELTSRGGGLPTGLIPFTNRDIWFDNNPQVFHDAINDGNLLNNYSPAAAISSLIYPSVTDLVVNLERYRTTVSNVAISFGGGSGGTTQTHVILVKLDGTEVDIGTWTQNGYQQTDNFPHGGTFQVAKLILRATTELSFGAEVRVTGTYQPVLTNPYSKAKTPFGYQSGANAHPWDFCTNTPHSVDTLKMNIFKSLGFDNGSIRVYDDWYAVQDVDGKWRIGTEVRGFPMDAAFTDLKTSMPNLFKWRDMQNQSLIIQNTWNISDPTRYATVSVVSYTDNGGWGTMQVTTTSITGNMAGVGRFHIYVGGVKVDQADQTNGSVGVGQALYLNVGGGKGYTNGQVLQLRKSQTSHVGVSWPASGVLVKTDMTIYDEVGKGAYVYASRLGNNANVPDYLSVDNTNGENPMTKGGGLVQMVESGNEWNSWWLDWERFWNGADYCLAWSMMYDGHMGQYPGRGVKNADPTMLMGSTGVASDLLDLWHGAVTKAKKVRGYNPDGTVNFPADVINVHCYSGGQHSGSSGAIPPEQGVRRQMQDLVWFNENILPKLQLFVSEWGFDANPNSPLGVRTFGSYTVHRQVAAMWYIRQMLLMSKEGVDRSQAYRMYQEGAYENYSNGDPWAGVSALQFDTMALIREVTPQVTYTRTVVGDYMKQSMEYKNYTFDSEIATGITGVYCYKFKSGTSYIMFLWSEEVTTITGGNPSFAERTGTFNVPVPSNASLKIRQFVEDGSGVMSTSNVTASGTTYAVTYSSKPKIIQIL